MRGRISLDGTYWVFSDDDDDGNNNDRTTTTRKTKKIVITIEKNIDESNMANVIPDYDWKGIYPKTIEDAILVETKYDEPEVLNVTEYTKSLGVDIHNLDMSKVDKTMFSTGMNNNMTKEDLDQLMASGYVKEVTKQSDGREYVEKSDDDDDDDINLQKPYSPYGDAIDVDEINKATEIKKNRERRTSTKVAKSSNTKIPFLDTPSPWNKNNNDDDPKEFESTPPSTSEQKDTDEEEAPAKTVTSATKTKTTTINDKQDLNSRVIVDNNTMDNKIINDPIDTLTVKKLQIILKEQGLKVSGSKKELQDRLRKHVNSLVIKNKKKGDKEQKID